MGFAFLGFCVNIEALFAFFINKSLCFLERLPDFMMEEIEKSGTKGVPEKSIVEMRNLTPGNMGTSGAFRNETVDMRVPVKRSAKGVKDTDETGSKFFRAVKFMKHFKNNTSDSGEKTIKKRAVFEKKMP